MRSFIAGALTVCFVMLLVDLLLYDAAIGSRDVEVVLAVFVLLGVIVEGIVRILNG